MASEPQPPALHGDPVSWKVRVVGHMHGDPDMRAEATAYLGPSFAIAKRTLLEIRALSWTSHNWGGSERYLRILWPMLEGPWSGDHASDLAIEPIPDTPFAWAARGWNGDPRQDATVDFGSFLAIDALGVEFDASDLLGPPTDAEERLVRAFVNATARDLPSLAAAWEAHLLESTLPDHPTRRRLGL